jgi:thiol:disulfide interchange protein DsbA
MHPISRIFIGFAAALTVASAVAQQSPPKEFYELTVPLPTDSPGKVEVTEFFWYGCPHCYALEPSLEDWVDKLPKDVVFKRMPAIFNDNWAISARIFYAFDQLGLIPRLHRAFFDAIHKDGLRPTDDDEVDAWLKKHAVDVGQFHDAEKSFGTESRMRRASQLLESAKIDGVPSIVVQGKWVVIAQASPSQMLQNVDKFIAQARKDLPAAQASQQPKGAAPKAAPKSSGKS